MAKHGASKLVHFLKREGGEYLRIAAHYDGDEREILYVRDDVDDQYTSREFDEIFDYWRRGSRDEGQGPLGLGNQHCTVRLYDGGIVFHFSQGDDVGTVVSLDPEAGRDMVGFVTRCLERLHHDSPQTIDNEPAWLKD